MARKLSDQTTHHPADGHHDRYFLDRVCNKIIEIDMQQIFTYEGNFDLYLKRRAERIEALTGELAKVRNTLRKEQEWMRRQPQARAGKARYRINAFYDLKERSRANYTERQIDPTDVRSSYIGSKIFEAEGSASDSVKSHTGRLYLYFRPI